MGPIFAIDPGTHAIGWAVFEEDTGGGHHLTRCGVLLLPPTGENRRDEILARRARASRRYRLRRRMRLTALRRILVVAGLLPPPGNERDRLFAADPFELRRRGLTEALTAGELARAILHLAARRGPLDGDCPPATGLPIASLWLLHRGPVRERQPVRARVGLDHQVPTFTRADLAAEFDALWAAQGAFHPDLGEKDLRLKIRVAAFGETSRPAGKSPHGNTPVRRALGYLSRLLETLAARHGLPAVLVWEAARPITYSDRAAGVGNSRSFQRRERLWRRDVVLQRTTTCPLSDAIITADMRLTRRVEVDHALPLALGGRRNLDNEALCLAEANRRKGSRPLPDRRRKRASARAGTSVVDPLASTAPHFANRRPRDMAMIAARLPRLIQRWPSAVVRAVSASDVAATAERLGYRTPEGKNRADVRHNAIDAVAAGMAAFPHLQSPAPSALRDLVAIAVAHQSRRNGRMHCETIYALARDVEGRPVVVSRKPAATLTAREIGQVRDPMLRARLRQSTDAADREPPHDRSTMTREHRVRRVRLARPSRDAIVLPANGRGAPERAVLSRQNFAIDIVALPDGSWKAFGITQHERLAPGWRPEWERERLGGKLVMRLRRGDCIEVDGPQGRIVLRVHRLAPSNGYVWVAGLAEAGNLAARHAAADDPFRFVYLSARQLRRRHARAVRFTADGVLVPRHSNVTGNA
jgi:hypothetical protein